MESKISYELYNIMDALAAIKMDLRCEKHIAGETVMLSAAQARGACKALETAAASVEKIRVALNKNGGS
jgi:hypothetical protein